MPAVNMTLSYVYAKYHTPVPISSVIPLLNKAHHPNKKSAYWRLFQTMEWDIRNRALKLSRLGLFPRIFGQDISKVFKQKYYGNLTIVPRFTTMQTFGLKALSNPSIEDMEGYLKYGQLAAWPYLNAIRDMVRLEKALDECLARLEERIRIQNPEVDWSNHDDVESIASSSAFVSSTRVRIVGRPHNSGLAIRDREAERTRCQVKALEQENKSLKCELERLRQQLAQNSAGSGMSTEEECEESRQEQAAKTPERSNWHPRLSEGSEGEIWNIIHQSRSENEL
jgi:regulator of replication initiation timing